MSESDSKKTTVLVTLCVIASVTAIAFGAPVVQQYDQPPKEIVEGAEKPVQVFSRYELPAEEITKLVGNANLSHGNFSGTLSNGTGWNISGLIFTITAKGEDGTSLWTSNFLDFVTIKPLTNGSFSITAVGDGGVKDYDWSIKKAFGHQKGANVRDLVNEVFAMSDAMSDADHARVEERVKAKAKSERELAAAHTRNMKVLIALFIVLSPLAIVFTLRRIMEHDRKQLENLIKSAANGNARVQSALGLKYETGNGVKKDLNAALNWYRKAADQGVVMAQINLGVMYEDGKGALQDYQEALNWYRKAADQGYAIAQFKLGAMYADGKGVLQDKAEAYAWLNIASVGGCKEFISRRDEVLKQMTPDQMTEGQKKAKEYLLKIEELKKGKAGK